MKLRQSTPTCTACGRVLPRAAFDVVRLDNGWSNGVKKVCRECLDASAERRRFRALAGAPDRFGPKVDRSGGPDACWPWTASVDKRGYGRLKMADGHVVGSHRFAWELANGRPVPAGLCVLHRCDNPPCCNPQHLFIGTKADNSADMVAKGRQARPFADHPERVLRGERVGTAKLTVDDVIAIRRLYADGGVTMACIGERYGVRDTCVLRIVRGQRWGHIPFDGDRHA